MKLWLTAASLALALAARAEDAAPGAATPATAPAASAPTAPAAAAAPKPEEKKAAAVKISGFFWGRYTQNVDQDGAPAARTGSGATATTATGFSIPRARVRASGDVAPGIGFVIEGDFNASTTSIVTDGFARVTLLPRTELRIGQQKTQFGYEEPETDQALLVINRALVSDALARGNGNSRDIGVGALGSLPVFAGLQLDWAGTLVNGAGPAKADDAIAPQKDFWGRVGPTLAFGRNKLKVGASFARGFDVGTSTTTPNGYRYLFRRYGVDVQLDTPWAFAVAEYVRGDDHLAPGTVDRAGGYLLAYGKTPWQVGPVARAEYYDPNDDVHGDHRHRYTFGAYYDYRPRNARLLLNYELDDSATRRDDALYAQVQVVF